MNTIFDEEIDIIRRSLASMNEDSFKSLLADCREAIGKGHKIIASGLGKNVPLCEKFIGTMVSLGIPAAFMHTNSAIHGDMGIIQDGDVVILLTKSGKTSETVHLYNLLKNRAVKLWLLTFSKDSPLALSIATTLALELEQESDPWNIVPNNSSIVNLIVLQKLRMYLADELHISLEDFKRNHPGGHIGEVLQCRN